MILYVSHPEVVIDPAVAVPRWHLSDVGVARMRAFAAGLARPCSVWSSTETKAIEAAGIVAARFGLGVQVHAGLDENDRSATGYLPPDAFQAAADQFFAMPNQSFRGWEPAMEAQARVVAAWEAILAGASHPVIVGHGGTGTLLWCALAGLAIDRRYDAPGQGCFWTFDRAAGVSDGWRPIG